MIIQLVIGFCILSLLVCFTWRSPRLSSLFVWSLVATLMLTSVLLIWLPGEFAEKARWVALSVPLIWVGLQYWCYHEASAKRVTASLIAMSCVFGLVVAFSALPV